MERSKKITEFRLALGWSKAELSRVSGISRSQITRLEKGETRDPHDTTVSLLLGSMENALRNRSHTIIQGGGPTVYTDIDIVNNVMSMEKDRQLQILTLLLWKVTPEVRECAIVAAQNVAKMAKKIADEDRKHEQKKGV